MNNTEYIKEMIQEGLFSVVFAKKQEDRTEEKAKEYAEKIDGAEGIACFANKDDRKKYWGVLVNSGKIAKSNLTKEKKKKENA